MESETKFVPQWLKPRRQNDTASNGPLRGGERFCRGMGGGVARDKEINKTNNNGGKVGNAVTYRLAEYRYGREEMLALFTPTDDVPDDLKDHPVFVPDPLTPLSLMPLTEEEQVLFLQNANSYSFKPYTRGVGSMRGMRGEYGDRGRGRGRGRDDEGRLRPREPWDDRSTRGHDFLGQGYDEGQSGQHKTDFYSPSSHHSSFNRSNSNDSWRSKNYYQDYDNNDYRKDKWVPKNWREPRSDRIQEEPMFFKGSGLRDQRPVELKRSKSLYEDEDSTQKGVPEWSMNDDEDLAVEGSFDSSGAYLTASKLHVNRTTDGSINEPNAPEYATNPVRAKETEKTDVNMSIVTAAEPSSPMIPRRREETTQNSKPPASTEALMTSTPIRVAMTTADPVASKSNVEIASNDSLSFSFDNLRFNNSHLSNVVGPGNIEIVKEIETNCLPRHFESTNFRPAMASPVDPNVLFRHPTPMQPVIQQPVIHQPVIQQPVVQQPVAYIKNTWYYIDPQGAIQGPFRDQDMAEWYYQGYFDMSLMLRAGEDDVFLSLGNFMSRVGHFPFAAAQPLVPNQMKQAAVSNQIVLPEPTQTILASLRHPIANQELVQQKPTYFPQQMMMQRHQRPFGNESLSNILPSTIHGANTTSSLFSPCPTQLPSLNSDSSTKMTWNQNSQVIPEKPLPEIPFTDRLPQEAPNIWNSGGMASQNVVNVPRNVSYTAGDGFLTGQRSFVGPNISYPSVVGLEPSQEKFSSTPDWEKIQAEKTRADDWRVRGEAMLGDIEERYEAMRKINEIMLNKILEKEENVKVERDVGVSMEMLRLQEAVRQEDVEVEKAFAQKNFVKEKIVEDNKAFEEKYFEEEKALEEDDFKPVEDTKKQKESKKKKEAKKKEEAKRQEEARRQEELKRQDEARLQEAIRRAEEQKRVEEQKRLEDQKKADELRKKQEEEHARRVKEASEEVKRKNLADAKKAQNVWSTCAASTRRSEVPKLSEIQSVEHARQMEEKQRQEIVEQKTVVVEQQRQQTSTTMANLKWKAPSVKSVAPKSLLDIQMEQASQMETIVKVQQPQPIKISDPPLHVGSKEPIRLNDVFREAFREVPQPAVAKKQQKIPAVAIPAVVIPAVVDSAQFPALVPKKSQAASKKVPAKIVTKATKDEVAARKIFNTVKVKDELIQWCEGALKGLKTEVDIPTLIDLLKEIDSPTEVMEYIHGYLGDSKQVREFAKQFIDKRNNYNLENVCWNVVEKQHNVSAYKPDENARADDKATKKGKKKGQKVDGKFLLGFTVHADPGRTNVGEIDSVPTTGFKK